MNPTTMDFKESAQVLVGAWEKLNFIQLLFYIELWLLTILAVWIAVRIFRSKIAKAQNESEDISSSHPTLRTLMQRNDVLICIGLFLLSLAIRLIGIGKEAFDSQELTYYIQSIAGRLEVSNGVLSFIITLFAPVYSPHLPLFKVLLYLWTLFAESAATLRFPSVVFGSLTLPLLYLWLKRDIGRQTAIMANVLLAISPFHVYYSQTIMPYTLIGLFGVGIYYLHTPALNGHSPPFFNKLYCLALALGFICHYIFFAFVAPLFIEVLWRYLRSDRKDSDRLRFYRYLHILSRSLIPFAIYSISIYAYFGKVLPHIMPFIDDMKLYAEFPGSLDALPVLLSELNHFFSHGIKSVFGGMYWGYVFLLSGITVLPGIFLVKHRMRPGTWMFLFPIISFTCFFIAQPIHSLLSHSFFYFASRRFVPIVPFLYALLAISLNSAQAFLDRVMKHKKMARWAPLVPFLFLTSLLTLELKQNISKLDKPDIPAAVQYVRGELRSGDGIATGPYAFFNNLLNYYFRDQLADWHKTMEPGHWQVHQGADPGQTDDRFLHPLYDVFLPWGNVLRHVELKRVWLLDINEAPYGFRELLGQGTIHHSHLITHGFSPCGRKEFNNVTVRCFERDLPAVPSDSLIMGRNDYPQSVGFSPPGQVPAEGRFIMHDATLIFPEPSKAKSIRMEILSSGMPDDAGIRITSQTQHHEQKNIIYPSEGKNLYEVTLTDFKKDRSDRFRLRFSLEDIPEKEMGKCAEYAPKKLRTKRCGYVLYNAKILR